ncbi:hypothetical protein MMYC01_209064 [Madurella mycetomatis]|uniref:Uncharacterized protein n=1 Tax=Madurella mycetomatis TaxID=100816 RepID=A0A175VSY9_9PEZI|nr:hypothetical protein MMYC01_209064 [Madurella mycetomatis]
MEQRDTVPAAPSTGIQDAPQNFLEALRQWKHYPDNLPSGTESAKLIEDFKRHFGETRGRVLLVPNLKDERLSRVRSGASEVCVHVHDYGTSIMGVMPRDEGGFDNTSRCVCSPGELTELLGLDMHSRPPTQPPDNHKHWAAATPLDFEPREDPVCRLM